jgi:hypothetical protein
MIINSQHGISPIVEKNDLSLHSATKTKRKVLIMMLAAAKIPAPLPCNSETANSAQIHGRGISMAGY